MLDDILQNTLSMMNPVIPCAGLMGESVTINTDDYGNKTFNIGRYTFYVKYVVWFLYHGYQSNKQIIHRNGNRADTRPKNLMQVRDFKRN